MPSPAELNVISKKILEGTATPGEKKIFDEWYETLPPEQTEWSSAGSEEALRLRMFNRIRAGIGDEVPVMDIRKRSSLVRRVSAAAAVLVIITTVYLFTRNTSVRALQEPKVSISAAVQEQVDYTRFITLPDGSTVLLHANSTLDYPATFDAGKREVTLSGEAYFDIQHNPAAPFLIKTGKLTTTVLGTAFNIRAYPGKEDITVAVKRGKVKVEEGSKLLAVLLPDELVTYNTVTSSAVKERAGMSGEADEWVRKEMVFDGRSFAGIADELEKRFGITISFKNPALEKCTIKAFFTGTEPIEKVMKILCTISNATYTWQSETHIVLDGAGCP